MNGWYKCGVCGDATSAGLVCGVCGALLCEDCSMRWVEGRAIVCEMCGNTLKDAAGASFEEPEQEPQRTVVLCK